MNIILFMFMKIFIIIIVIFTCAEISGHFVLQEKLVQIIFRYQYFVVISFAAAQRLVD